MLKNFYTISVGIPTYNEKNTITFLLDSIIKQTLPKHLIIKEVIVSDCSKDETPMLVERYKDKLPIRLFHHSSRMGLNYAINEIFQNASSDFIIYVNADTKLHSQCITRLILPLVNRPSLGLTSANMVPLVKSCNLIQKGCTFGAFLLSDIRKNLGKLVFHGRAFAIRSTLAKKIKIPSNVMDQDTFLCYACFDRGFACEYIHDAICYYIPPSSIRDFVLPNRIYSAGLKQLHLYKPEWFKKYELTRLFDKDLFRIYMRNMFHDPIGGFIWTSLKIVEMFYPIKNSDVAVLKPQAKTTKVPLLR